MSIRAFEVNPGELEHPGLPGMIARMEAGDYPELLGSVATLGVQIPVIVRRDDDVWRIVDGMRRVAAALVTGRESIPAIEADVALPTEFVTLLANLVRQENPVAEFRAARALMERGMTAAEIAAALGVHRTTVAYRMRLERVMPEILDEAERGRVPYSVLRRLPSYDETVQAEVLRRLRAGERVRVKDLDEIAQAGPVAPVEALGGIGEAVAKAEAEQMDDLGRLREALGLLERAAALVDPVVNRDAKRHGMAYWRIAEAGRRLRQMIDELEAEARETTA